MSAMLPREKLAAVLGMLGSDHDGEVLAAARQAERMRRQAGLAWADLIAAERPAVAPGRRPDPPPPEDWRALVAWCQQRPDAMTNWERDFLATIAAYRHPPSDRQREILDRLAAKVRAA